MCGICFAFSPDATSDVFVNELLDRRGPDYQSSHSGWLCQRLSFLAHGYVLWMRGDAATPQPVINKRGDILLWNGNIFDGIKVPDGVSDTSHLADLLSGASESTVLSTLSSVCGPWAVIFWQSAERRLWFGRDPLGRRSLLWNGSPGRLHPDSFILTSVGGRHRSDLTEVPCLGLISVHVPEDCTSCAELRPRLHPWSHVIVPPAWLESVAPGSPLRSPAGMTINAATPDPELTALLETGGDLPEAALLPGMAAAIDQFEAAMLAAVQCRVENMPAMCADCLRVSSNAVLPPADCTHARLAVLFSGGVDSMLVAAMADRCLPDDQPVDLLNVAFERPAPPPGANVAAGGRRKAARVKIPRGRPADAQTGTGSPNTGTGADLETPSDADVGTPGTETAGSETASHYDVLDRLTGRDGWRELQRINQRRQWNFVEINVTAEELGRRRGERVRHLISPLQTVLDDSIGCAVWFAARGVGVLAGDDPRTYCSPARVVLVGMGADEQLAGYGRHRSAFRNGSWPGLVAEIQMQLLGICERNLGRDDRVISDHGREARFPFLDEAVVSFLSSLPVWLKTQPGPQWTECNKLPIRLLTERCGAPAAARRTKRAIQFGSRIAKLENRTEKAADICSRLTDGDVPASGKDALAPASGEGSDVRVRKDLEAAEAVKADGSGSDHNGFVPAAGVTEGCAADLNRLAVTENGECDDRT